MTNADPTTDHLVGWNRRITGSFVLLLLAFWLFMLISHLLSGEKPPQVPWTEYARGPGMVTLCLLAMLLAWWRPLAGGAISIVSAVAIAIAMSPATLLAYSIVAAPFLLVGLLSVERGWRTRKLTDT